MAIHLILKAINEVNTYLRLSVHILSDCLGALKKIEDLPLYRIPTQCRHSDILKNIMANCSGLLFNRIFSHVKAHQDDNKKYSDLSRDAQLNCQMDYLAKSAIYEAPHTQHEWNKCFPLEPLCVLLGPNKVTLVKGTDFGFGSTSNKLARHSTKPKPCYLINSIGLIGKWCTLHFAKSPECFRSGHVSR
jgi:hypothetical protein